MRDFQIDRARLQPLNPDPIADLCWQAMEILAGHREFDDGEPDEDMAGTDGEYPVFQVIGEPIPDLELYQTPPVPINDTQHVSLSNLPLIIGIDGTLKPLAQPGYVALVGEPQDTDESPEDPKKSSEGIPLSPQLIFCMPQPPEMDATGKVSGELAAIYEGYELIEPLKITAGHTGKIKHIGMLLQCVRVGLRDWAENDTDAYQGKHYFQTPVRSVMRTIDKDLSKFFGY